MDDPKITKATLTFIWWVRDTNEHGANAPIQKVMDQIEESDPNARIEIKENLDVLIDYYGADATIKYVLD